MGMDIKSLTTTKKYSTANENISKQYYYLKMVLTSTVIGFLTFNMLHQVNSKPCGIKFGLTGAPMELEEVDVFPRHDSVSGGLD